MGDMDVMQSLLVCACENEKEVEKEREWVWSYCKSLGYTKSAKWYNEVEISVLTGINKGQKCLCNSKKYTVGLHSVMSGNIKNIRVWERFANNHSGCNKPQCAEPKNNNYMNKKFDW